MKTRASHVSPAVNPPTPVARWGAWLFALAMACVVSAGVAHADPLKDGKEALAQGRIDDAVTAYRNAVQAQPGEALPHQGLGLALEKKRAWQAALAEFLKANELDPGLAEPLRGAGACYLRLEQPDKAEAAFRKATQIDHKFPDAQLGLGESLARLKRYDEAIAVLNDGLKFGTKTQPAFYMGIGHTQALRDSLRAAEVALVQAREAAMALSAPPTVLGPIYRSLGDLYMQRKIPELAIQNYQQAKSIDPNDLDTRMALGDAFYNGQLYNDAAGEYKAVVAADSDYAEGYLKLGNLYYLASFADPPRDLEAVSTLETLLRKDPTNLQGKALLAQALYRTGNAANKQRALQLLNEVSSGGTLPPAAYPIRGRIEYEAGDYAKAIADFRQSRRLETIDQLRIADSFRRLATAAADSTAKAAFYDSAGTVYRAIYDADTTSADAKKAQLESARLQYFRKNYPAAIVELSRTIALDPNSAEAYNLTGLSYRAMKDDANAVIWLKKSLALDPKQPGIWLQLGATYDGMKDDADAIDAFQHTAALDSTTTGAIALQQLGYKALVKKSYPAAIQLLEDSTRRDPKQILTWVWLGQAYQNSGNRAKAIECYHHVLELKPGQPDAVKGLKSLGTQ
jgi:tetratricopeptide (TPR) repeat protein